MKKRMWCLSLSLLLFSAHLLAQTTLSGKVTDEKGNPLAGVTVQVKQTQVSTSTGSDGVFKIPAPNTNATLVFSSIDFLQQEVPAAGRSEVNVSLTTNVNALSDVVVVGYGTQKRRNVTSS